MIRLLTAGTRIALVVVAIEVIVPMVTFAQTPESATESIPVEAEVAEGAASLAGDEDSTDQDTSVQTEQAGAVEAEIQRRINEPQDWLNNLESGSTIIRNVGLVIAAVIALWFARRRILVADRQAATAQRGLLNERYQKGAEMLGNDVLSVRLGGIYALARLAREYPGGYHTQIMNLLCSFVRNPPVDDGARDPKASGTQLREDVQATMPTICARSEVQVLAEKKEIYFRLDLSGADLHGISLLEATSLGSSDRRPPISSANLEGAFLHGANLSGAGLVFSNLKGASLYRANLEGAFLHGADLSGANLRGCEGLTQEQLDQAKADSRQPAGSNWFR